MRDLSFPSQTSAAPAGTGHDTASVPDVGLLLSCGPGPGPDPVLPPGTGPLPRPAADPAQGDPVARWAVRRVHRDLFGVFEQGVEPRSADDSDLCELRHAADPSGAGTPCSVPRRLLWKTGPGRSRFTGRGTSVPVPGPAPAGHGDAPVHRPLSGDALAHRPLRRRRAGPRGGEKRRGRGSVRGTRRKPGLRRRRSWTRRPAPSTTRSRSTRNRSTTNQWTKKRPGCRCGRSPTP